jgi:hypothetical protein
MLMEFAIEDCQDDDIYRGWPGDHIESYFREGWLVIDELTELSPEQANSLRWYPGNLRLLGAQKLTAESAWKLALHKGLLCLGVERLEADAAEALSTFAGEGLVIEQVTSLSTDVAEAQGNRMKFEQMWVVPEN